MFNNSFALINFVLILFCEQPVNRPLVERGTREREKPFPFLAIFSPNREPVHRLFAN